MTIIHHKRMSHYLLGLLLCSLVVVLVYVSANLTTFTFHARRESVSAETVSSPQTYYGSGSHNQQEESSPAAANDGDPYHSTDYYRNKAFITVVTNASSIDATVVAIHSLQTVSKTQANIVVVLATDETTKASASFVDQFAAIGAQLLHVSPGFDPIPQALTHYRKLVYFSNEILFKKNVDHYFGYPAHAILQDSDGNVGLRVYERSNEEPPSLLASVTFPLSNEEIFWFNGPMKPWDFYQYHDTDWRKFYDPISFHQWRSLYDTVVASSPSITANDWSNRDRRKLICTSPEIREGIQQQQQPTIQDRFSVLLSTYKPERIQHLTLLIRHLLQSSYIHEIFVTWHNPKLDVPAAFTLEEWDDHRVRVLPQSFDSLNNRFNPVTEIQTEAVYILDDDVFIDIDDLEFTFKVWQQGNNKDSIVGHFPRIHQYDPDTHETVYKVANKDTYSMVLTKSMFVRTEYLFAYTCLMDTEMHHDIDTWTNCEDIAFNMMVSGLTGAPAIAVTPQNSIIDFGLKNGISTNLQHMGSRSECVKHFITNYWNGKDPLLVSSSAVVPYHRPAIRRGNWDKIEQILDRYHLSTVKRQACDAAATSPSSF